MAFTDTLADLEAALLNACAGETEWAEGVAAAIYAGVDYAIAHPEAAEVLMPVYAPQDYERAIGRMVGFLRAQAPIGRRLPGSADEALVRGIVGLVGDHLRLGRVDRLKELRPELVLLMLLPYLGFSEAQERASRYHPSADT
jgi:hypothetical protein